MPPCLGRLVEEEGCSGGPARRVKQVQDLWFKWKGAIWKRGFPRERECPSHKKVSGGPIGCRLANGEGWRGVTGDCSCFLCWLCKHRNLKEGSHGRLIFSISLGAVVVA